MLRNRQELLEYGDWQTNYDFALSICRSLKAEGISPQVIIEPTCGKGNFILAALEVFEDVELIYGIEIQKPYLVELQMSLAQRNSHPKRCKIELINANIFDCDFSSVKEIIKNKRLLILGNLPWVTNSKLGVIGSKNLPTKANFKHTKGLDAITGKGNFDIAESICYLLMNHFASSTTRIALLVKSSVIKNILLCAHLHHFDISFLSEQDIDAKKEFGASVSAALMIIGFGGLRVQTCSISDFYTQQHRRIMGWTDGKFVSDIEAYKKNSMLDGKSPIPWRSGIKHDCSPIMELTKIDWGYKNKIGESVDIESDLVYPLIKSSDVGTENITTTHRYVIVTQRRVGESTAYIKAKFPKTYQYLHSHIDKLKKRKSSIYTTAPDFAIFGVGDYSFKPYKVVISGLYKHTLFTVVYPIDGKPTMVDDTCYSLGFDTLEEALTVKDILNSSDVQSFIHSLMFRDAKRVITKDLLMRIDLYAAIDQYRSSCRETNDGMSRFLFTLLSKYPRVASLF